MKNFLSLICVIFILVLSLVLTGCSNIENEEINNSINFNKVELDYNDSSSFEKALNSGKEVKGKTVKFDVKNYVPDSAMGINCWSGEHLNFISDNELDVKTGDIIIGRVKEEPSSFLGSWKIKYDVIEIQGETQKNDMSEDGSEEMETIEKNNVENEKEQSENKIDENIEVDNNKTNEGENQITYNYYTTNDNEDAKKGNTGVYSYIKKGDFYDIYYIIDFDNGYIYYFNEGEDNDWCDKLKIKSGDLNSTLLFTYHDGGDVWDEALYFKYKNQPSILILEDGNHLQWEFSPTNLENALKLRDMKKITER